MTEPRRRDTAKIFMHGRSQAVRLPKEFRLPGKEARVRKSGDKVILEPMEKPEFDVERWWTRLEEFRDVPFPELPGEPPAEPDQAVSFD